MTQDFWRPVECTTPTDIVADQIHNQLRRRFETEKSFSFSSTDDILPISFLLQVNNFNHFKASVPDFRF